MDRRQPVLTSSSGLANQAYSSATVLTLAVVTFNLLARSGGWYLLTAAMVFSLAWPLLAFGFFAPVETVHLRALSGYYGSRHRSMAKENGNRRNQIKQT